MGCHIEYEEESTAPRYPLHSKYNGQPPTTRSPHIPNDHVASEESMARRVWAIEWRMSRQRVGGIGDSAISMMAHAEDHCSGTMSAKNGMHAQNHEYSHSHRTSHQIMFQKPTYSTHKFPPEHTRTSKYRQNTCDIIKQHKIAILTSDVGTPASFQHLLDGDCSSTSPVHCSTFYQCAA